MEPHTLVQIIFLILIVLVAVLYSFKENFDNGTVDLVISRYNEDLKWLADIDLTVYRKIIIYNKGKPLTVSQTTTIIDMPNVGRCDHTYIYHIITNYDDLADVTVFLPGSCDMEYKWQNAKNTIDKANETKMSAFYCSPANVPAGIANFQLDKWKASNPANQVINSEDSLELCPERPFGKWYAKHFGDLQVNAIVFYGIFAVSRECIHNRSLESYKQLISYLDHNSNPEAGHYFERSWLAIFNPVQTECIFL